MSPDFLGIFNDLPPHAFFNAVIISIWTKNLLIEENIRFLIQNVRESMDLFADIFYGKFFFFFFFFWGGGGVPWTLVLITSNTKITTTGKMSFWWNSLFEKLNILRKRFKKCVEDFLTKISSFENESGVNQ